MSNSYKEKNKALKRENKTLKLEKQRLREEVYILRSRDDASEYQLAIVLLFQHYSRRADDFITTADLANYLVMAGAANALHNLLATRLGDKLYTKYPNLKEFERVVSPAWEQDYLQKGENDNG